jgi:aspartyl-tRNA(Asn)/glutamyl-tRNA(Gln) amidotransferase subunit C
MAAIPELNIDHVARLARLELSETEKVQFADQLGEVLHHIAQLGKIDVSGVEPTAHAFPVENIWAEDAAEPGLTASEALSNAPAKRDGMISVPKVVE